MHGLCHSAFFQAGSRWNSRYLVQDSYPVTMLLPLRAKVAVLADHSLKLGVMRLQQPIRDLEEGLELLLTPKEPTIRGQSTSGGF